VEGVEREFTGVGVNGIRRIMDSDTGYPRKRGQTDNDAVPSDDDDEESSLLIDHALVKEDERYAILDSSLDQLGFGRFQYKILILTGFGTFVDALEANLVSILYPVFISEQFATSYMDLALVSSLQAVGTLTGSIVLGILSDKLGRRLIYLVSLVIVVVFGIVSSFASDVVSFALLRLCLGFGYGGNSNTATSLMLEMMPSTKRGVGSAVHSFSWGFGSLLIASIAWIAGESFDWRWLVRIPSLIAIPIMVAVWWTPESPRYHIHNDDNPRLLQSIEEIARVNAVEVPPSMNADNLDSAREQSRRRHLLVGSENFLAQICSSLSRLCTSKQYMAMLLPLGLVWLFNGLGGTIITWLPLHGTKIVPNDYSVVYAVAFISACGILIASSSAFLTGTRFKRQHIIRFGLFCTVAFAFGIAFALTIEPYYALTFFLCFSHQLTNGALFLYTPEILPTNVRSTGFGMCLALFRVGFVFAPFIAAVLTDNQSFQITCSAFGGFFVIAFLFALCTNVNTVNVPLKERAKA